MWPFWLYITDHGSFGVALHHVTLSRGVQNNHSHEIFDPYLLIHYATFMRLRWRLRGILRRASPIVKRFIGKNVGVKHALYHVTLPKPLRVARTQKSKKTNKFWCANSRIRGNETPWRIVTKFCTGVGVHDVITCADLYYDRLWGMGVAGGQILGFSIDLLRRSYNILSHYRDGVSKLIGKLRRAITSWECLCVPAAQQQLFPPTFVYVCLNGVPSGFVGGGLEP